MKKIMLLCFMIMIMMLIHTPVKAEEVNCGLEPLISGVKEKYYYEIGSDAPNYKDGVSVRSGCDLSYTVSLVVNDQNVVYTKEGSYVINFNALDFFGNDVSVLSQVIVIYDMTNPVIEGTRDLTVEINETVDYLEGVTVSDNKDTEINEKLTFDDTVVDTTAIGEYPLYYRATDASGNKMEVEVKVTVVDTMKPVVTGTEDLTIEVHTNLETYPFYEYVVVTDNSNLTVNKTINVDEVIMNKVGKYSFSYVFTDIGGNETIHTHFIEVVDTTKPILTLIEPITSLINQGAINYGNYIEVSDNYSNLNFSNVIVDDSHVDYMNPGHYYVHFFVGDQAGNYQTLTTDVIVLDNDVPVFQEMPEIRVPVHTTSIDYMDGVSVTDVTDGNLINYVKVIKSNVNLSKIGEYKVFYVVTDRSKHITIVMRDVEVFDNETPQFSGLTAFKIEVFDSSFDLLKGITVVDDYDGDLTEEVLITHEINFDVLGDYLVTYTVKDGSNNESIETVTISIVDTTKPTLVNVKDITVTVGGTIDLGVDIRAFDNYDGDITSNILIKGEYNLSIANTYEMKVEINDSSGNFTYEYFKLIVKAEVVEKEEESSFNFYNIDKKILYVIGSIGATVIIGGTVQFWRIKHKKK